MTTNEIEKVAKDLLKHIHFLNGECDARAILRITETLTTLTAKHDEEKAALVKQLIPYEKPMSVFSFVLKGEELEQYNQHKGWNRCREEMQILAAKYVDLSKTDVTPTT